MGNTDTETDTDTEHIEFLPHRERVLRKPKKFEMTLKKRKPNEAQRDKAKKKKVVEITEDTEDIHGKYF